MGRGGPACRGACVCGGGGFIGGCSPTMVHSPLKHQWRQQQTTGVPTAARAHRQHTKPAWPSPLAYTFEPNQTGSMPTHRAPNTAGSVRGSHHSSREPHTVVWNLPDPTACKPDPHPPHCPAGVSLDSSRLPATQL